MNISTLPEFLHWNGVGNILLSKDFIITLDDVYTPITLSSELIIDGQGHSIQIDELEWNGLFLISGIAKVNIKNLSIIFTSKTNINNGSGGILGDCTNSGSSYKCVIEQCNVTGNTYQIVGQYSGGIVGNNAKCNIVNCYTNGNILGIGTGGIAGANFIGNITGCLSTGKILGPGSGGISGINTNSNSNSNTTYNMILFCYTIGQIGASNNVNARGGICGGGSTKGYIYNCYTLGDLYDNVGGIIGGMYNGEIPDCDIVNCYVYGIFRNSSGTVTGAVGSTGCDKVKINNVYSLNASGNNTPFDTNKSTYKQFVGRGIFITTNPNHLNFSNSSQWKITPLELFNIDKGSLSMRTTINHVIYDNIWCDSKENSDPKTMLTEPPMLTYYYKEPWNHRKFDDNSKVKPLQPSPDPVPDPGPTPPPIPQPTINVINLGDLTHGNDDIRSTFMRGDPYTTEIGYYVVGRSKSGSYYYLIRPLENVSEITKAIFTSTPFTEITRESIIIYPKKIKNEIYSFTGTYFPLITSTSTNLGNLYLDNLGAVNIGTNDLTNFTLKAVDSNNNSGEYIYPGLWYNLYNSSGTLSNYYIESSSDGNITTLNYGALDIMFIPINTANRPLNVWIKNQCDSTNTISNLGLQWFNNWVIGKEGSPNGCDGPSYTTAIMSNCFFSNTKSCQTNYLYKVGETSTECGVYLGFCKEENGIIPPCIYNPDGGPTSSQKPMTCSSSFVPDNPDVPDAGSETWEEWFKKYWYIWLIVGIIILGGIIYWLYKWSSSENPDYAQKVRDANFTQYEKDSENFSG